jgi:flagellar biosynthetic protein FliR
MIFTEAQLSAWLAAFMWPLIRISAMIAAAPIFSSRQTPKRLRVGIALLLSFMLMPLIPPPPIVEVFSPEALLIAVQQVLIGLAMGFVMQMVFGALVFGGQALAYSMGLGFASMMDPQNGVQVPVLSQYYIILATLLFLILNGHLFMIETLAQSFYTLPIAVDGITQANLRDVVLWASRMFTGGLLIALPAIAALLLVNLGMGIITRAAPQLNIFAVGFPMTMMIGFILMWITLPNVLAKFSELVNEALTFIRSLVLIAT